MWADEKCLIEWLLLNSNTCNHFTVCKEMINRIVNDK